MIDELPLWIAILIVFFLLSGAIVTLIGAIGLLRFHSFYERLHMPGLGTSCGICAIVIASVLYSCLVNRVYVFHQFLLILFLFITTPVSLMMLSRAALHRDGTQDWGNINQDIQTHCKNELHKLNEENEEKEGSVH